MLAETSEQLHRVLEKFRAYETNLEIENCEGDTRQLKHHYLEWLIYFAKDFSIHGCQLTFQDLACIICRMYRRDSFYDLSDNVFIDKDSTYFAIIKKWISMIRESKESLKILDLRKCNFSVQEKEELMKEATSLNLLI